MSDDIKTAQEDLAFIRSIVDEGGRGLRTGGIGLIGAGACFGTQTLIAWLEILGAISLPEGAHLYIALIAIVAFFVIIGIEVWKSRKEGISWSGGGVTSRAMGAAFSGAGIANAVLAAVFGYAAYSAGNWMIWLLFPVVVCVLQGVVWYIAALIQRKWWMGGTGAAWFVVALAMGMSLENMAPYLFFITFGLYVLMVGPGIALYRMGAKSPEPK